MPPCYTCPPVRTRWPTSALDSLRDSSPPSWLVPVWLGGVSVFYLYNLIAWVAATRLRTRGAFAAPTEWRERLDHLAAAMGVRRHVVLLESCLAEVPVVIGYLRPVILLPVGMLAGLSTDQVEAVLIHELAHIRRFDYLVNVLQTLVEGLLFYHPAVWWTGSVMRREREHCCDDVVVSLQGDAHGYAATLARLELSRGAGREPALAATGGNLMMRIRRLMQQPEGPRFAAPLVSAAILLAGATLALAAWQNQTPPQIPPPPTPPVQAPPVQPAPAPAPHHLVEALPQRTVEPLPQTAEPLSPRELKIKEKRLRQELITPYRKWLNEDVAYIITDEERSVFKRLETDEERENFIGQFWKNRPPASKEEHYRRIAYANEHYASLIPGWKTDRGRIYITYGPPDSIEDRGATATTMPVQTWLYKRIPDVGDNIVIDFVDQTGTGEYRMAQDPSDAALPLPLHISFGVSPAPNSHALLVSLMFPLDTQGHKTQILGRITTIDRRPVSNFEEEVSGTTGLYTRQVPLVRGSYRAIVIVKDMVTGTRYQGELVFDAQ